MISSAAGFRLRLSLHSPRLKFSRFDERLHELTKAFHHDSALTHSRKLARSIARLAKKKEDSSERMLSGGAGSRSFRVGPSFFVRAFVFIFCVFWLLFLVRRCCAHARHSTTSNMSSKSSSAAPAAGRWRKFTLAPRGNSKALVPRLPPGFDHNTSTVVVQKLPAKELAERKLRMQNMQCMAIAKKPFGSIFMIAFMCWITGASMHIFSIMQLFMVFSNAVSAILNTPAAFKNVGHPNPFK